MKPEPIDELERARAALAASELRLQLVLKGSNDGWWDWDLQRNELFYSPRWWSMLGYQPDELPNDAALWERLRHPDDASHVELVFGAALRFGPDNYEVEFRLRHKQGHYVPILSRGHILRDASGRAVRVSGSNTDLSLRKEAEEALRRSEAQHRLLIDHLLAGVIVHAPDGRVLLGNPQAAKLLGLSVDALQGRRADDAAWRFVREDGTPLPSAETPAARVLARPQTLTDLVIGLDHPVRGERVWLLANAVPELEPDGALRQVVVTLVDISARLRAEQAGRDSDASQRALLESMTDGVFVAQDHRFVFANPALPAMLGYTSEEFIGLPFDQVIDPEFLALWTQRFEQRVGTGAEPPRHYELRLLTKGRGASLWVELRASRLEFQGRRSVLGILRDIGERKRAEAALQASQQLAQATLDGLTAHVCVLDEYGIVLATNRAWRAFAAANDASSQRTGVGIDYLRVCESAGPAASAEAARFAAALREVLAGRSERFDLAYPCATPQGPRWFLARVSRGSGDGPVRVIVAHEDITERVDAEHRIAHLNQRLALAIRGAGYGIWELALDTRTLVWDEQMLVIYGHTREAFDGAVATWTACVHPEDRAEVDRRFAELLDGSAVEHFRFRIVRASDGAVRQIEANGYLQRDGAGHPQRLVGMNRDITAHTEAELALRQSEERWNFALEGSGDGVWDWDVGANRVLYSRRWKEMLGHGDDEIGGGYDEWRGRVHPDDLARVESALQDYLAGRAPDYALEHRLRCKDGGWKWVLTRGLVVRRDADGRPSRLVGTHSDLSERKQAEATRTALETQLREAQKMEAIGTLAGGVAHDFNNMLAGILGNVALASQDVGAHHPAQASLEQIRRAGLRARSLVQQILAFSRRQPQQLLSQPLRPMVEETLALLRSTLPAAVVLDAQLPAEPLHVLADATQLQQVLMNLCTNAWHALQGGAGRIEVGLQAQHVPVDAATAAGAVEPGRYAHLWVADNGCGIDADAKARIFDPFFTTKPVGQGTGLGLAVVHGIVAAHGGAITVDSTPGVGSRFDLYLPLATAPAAAAGPAEPNAAARGSGQQVVYIDDDEIMVLTVERLLQRAGYRVNGFLDPRAALDALRAAPARFDLVVTDYNMPELSGLDVLREVAAIRADLPIVISSGYISDALRAEARAAGVRGLLCKENTVEELAELVHRVLAGREG